jgi:hypothetical protein
MQEPTKQAIGRVIDQLARLFEGTPGAELLGLGNVPALDIPAACRYPFGSHAPECPPGDHTGFVPEPVCAACGRELEDDAPAALIVGPDGPVMLHLNCAGID